MHAARRVDRVNANLLRRWIAAREANTVVERSTSVAEFVPVPLATAIPTPAQDIVVELGCMAHARREFFDLLATNKSEIAQTALEYIGKLYDIQRDVQEGIPHERLAMRQERARPLADTLHQWMTQQRARVSEGSAIAKALDYSLRRWSALTRYLDDPQVPIDNNWCENQIRPIAIGKKNWLFAGSLRAGKRAAAIMSLVQSAKLNGHDPYAYLKDVLARLPSHPAAHIEELLPHQWQGAASS